MPAHGTKRTWPVDLNRSAYGRKSDVQMVERDSTISVASSANAASSARWANQCEFLRTSRRSMVHRLKKSMRAKRNLLKRFNLIWVVQSRAQKQFAFSSPRGETWAD
jgi:hypothetical protein